MLSNDSREKLTDWLARSSWPMRSTPDLDRWRVFVAQYAADHVLGFDANEIRTAIYDVLGDQVHGRGWWKLEIEHRLKIAAALVDFARRDPASQRLGWAGSFAV